MQRPLVTALVLASALVVLGGCGWVGGDSGVASVRSERVGGAAADPSITSPPLVVASVPDDEATSDVEEVDTLVEPELSVRPRTIAVVGDSLTLSAEDELLTALTSAGLDVLAIDALESRRITRGGIPPGVDAVEEIVAEADPGLWVIALGTNDVAAGSLDGFRSEVRTLLELIPEESPVIWVDLWIGGQEETTSRANLQLRAELGRWQGGSAVVNWFSHGLDDGIITGDGVHLTPAGQELFAATVVAAVDELFPTP